MTEPDPNPPGPAPEPPAGGSGPWMDDNPRMSVAASLVEVLQGSTAGGLPYPESTDPLNQGANAIKALAMALDTRGAGYKSMRGRSRMTFSGGRPPPINVTALGLTAIGGVLLSGEWGDGPPVPMTIAVETSVTTLTSIGLLGYCPPTPGSNPQNSSWYTGPCWVSWLVWGV